MNGRSSNFSAIGDTTLFTYCVECFLMLHIWINVLQMGTSPYLWMTSIDFASTFNNQLLEKGKYSSQLWFIDQRKKHDRKVEISFCSFWFVPDEQHTLQRILGCRCWILSNIWSPQNPERGGCVNYIPDCPLWCFVRSKLKVNFGSIRSLDVESLPSSGWNRYEASYDWFWAK